jgi:hypothetical protein
MEDFRLHGFADEVSQQDLVEKAFEFCEQVLKQKQGFLGMILRGGVGRGTGDRFSDIDYTAIFDSDDLIPNEYRGPHIWSGAFFSGLYLSKKGLENVSWNTEMLHGYSHACLIHCDQQLTSIIEGRLKTSESEWLSKIIDNICLLGMICRFRPEYRGWTTQSEIFKKVSRGEISGAHLEIDRGLRLIKSLIFDMNKIHYPEEKNFFSRAFSGLPIQPAGIDELIEHNISFARVADTIWIRTDQLAAMIEDTLQLVEQQVELPTDLRRAFYGG